jgi:hypothetical protein
MRRAAEIRCGQLWARTARALGALKAVRVRCESRTIAQRTKIAAELSATLKTIVLRLSDTMLRLSDQCSTLRASAHNQ